VLRRENPQLISQLEAIFPLHSYFSLSAYGHGNIARYESGNGIPPMPFQVLLPIIWLLTLTKHIPILVEYDVEIKGTSESKRKLFRYRKEYVRLRHNLLEPKLDRNRNYIFDRDLDGMIGND
jgi:hypothetical protein